MQSNRKNLNNRWSRHAVAVAMLATAGLAQSADAQITGWYSSSTGEFDVDFDGCPDFDQVRSAGFHPSGAYVDGLPNSGLNYCVPSASGNLLAYLALHGVDTVFPTGYYWGDSDALTYGKVTKAIERLGDRMDTDPDSGTTPDGMLDGLTESLPADDFEVAGYAAPRNHLTVPDMARIAAEGGLIAFCYGRYTPEEDEIDSWMRDTGHCMTFVGASRVAGETRRLWFQDPGSGGSNEQSQSSFTKAWSVFHDNEWRFRSFPFGVRRDYSEIYRRDKTYTELIDYACVIMPEETTLSFEDPSHAGTARVPNNPEVKARLIQSSDQEDDIAEDRAIDYAGLFDAIRFVEMAYAPSLIETVSVVEDSDGQSRLLVSDYARGEAQQISNAIDLTINFTTSRFGELYVAVGNELWYYGSISDLWGQEAEPIIVLGIPPGLVDIGYHDATDRLVLLFDGDRPEVRTVDRDLGASSLSAATSLPGIASSREMEIATDPGAGPHDLGQLWVLSHDEGVIVGFDMASIDSGEPAEPTHALELDGEVRNLQVDEQGDLFFRQNNRVRHFVASEDGELTPRADSPRWGLESGGAFAVTVARDPFIEGIHDQPEWLNFPSEGGGDEGLRGDRGVERGDVAGFVDLFLQRDEAADVNHDGRVDSRDMELFFRASTGG